MVDYSKDGPFSDPVVRCDKCNKLLLLDDVKQTGMCPHCGARRIRNLLAFDGDELAQMKKWAVPEEFIALFQEGPTQ